MQYGRRFRGPWALVLFCAIVSVAALVAVVAGRFVDHGGKPGRGGEREALEPTSGEQHESGEAEEINARESWFYRQRAFPGRRIPPGAMKRAQAQARGLGRDIASDSGKANAGVAGSDEIGAAPLSASVQAAPTAPLNWTAIGPRPIGGAAASQYNGLAPYSGRVTAIATHPTNSSIAYLGGAAGGVWKTIDSGLHWTPIFDSQASLAIGTIAIDPQNGNTLYVGTGEANFCCDSYFGRGIYKSGDAGATWSKLGGTLFDGCYVADIVVKPGTSTTIFAAVHAYGKYTTGCDSGVFRSINGGTNWTKVDFGPVTDLAVKPGAPNTWYAAYDASGIWRSTDGGTSWSQLGGGLPTTNLGRIAIAVTAANPLRVYAAFENSTNGSALGVWTSADSGSTWTSLPRSNFCGYTDTSTSGQCSYDLALAAYPANQSYVYAGGIRVQRYDGVSWTTLGYGTGGIHVDIHAVAFDAANRLWIGSDGGVYRKDSSTTGFTNLNATLSLTQFEPGTSGSVGVRFVGGTQDNGTLRYEASSSAWYEFETGDGGYSAVDPANANVIYSTYVYATASKSTDGGANSTCIFTASAAYKSSCSFYTTDSADFYSPLLMDPANAQRLYIGTTRLWRTSTGGSAWAAASPVFAGTISAVGVAKSTSSTLYAAWQSNPTVLRRTTNAGVNWTATAALPNRIVTDIEVNPTSAAVAYATLSGFNTQTPATPGHLFRTTNSGASWTNISGNLPDSPANAVAVDYRTSPATLYVGTDVGVFWSVDGGVSWANASRGLPNTVVADVRLDLQTNKVIAATHGRGAYTVPVASPSISGFTPTSGRTGTTVTISGKNFTGVTAVKFNGKSAAFTVVSPTQITATVPNGATSGKVTVTTGAGTASSTTNYTVTLSVTGFSPTSGPTGTKVTISGIGFTGASAVKFNGTAAAYTVVSGSTITATVPATATTGKISVTAPAGTVLSALSFTKT